MTIESTNTKTIFLGNGTATLFPIQFQYSRGADLHLVLTDQGGKESIITDNFSIAVNEAGDTSVKYPVSGAAMPAGCKLTVYRNTPQTQIVDLINGGAFNPDVLEHDGFDRAVMMIQELQEEVDRAIKVSISDDKPPATAEEIYININKIADRAESAAGKSEAARDRAEIAADKAEMQYDRVKLEGETQWQRVHSEGIYQTERAKIEAGRAENAANSIPGFAANAYTLFGFDINDYLELTITKAQNGDVMSLEDFHDWCVLPDAARFYVDQGNLILELPFLQA